MPLGSSSDAPVSTTNHPLIVIGSMPIQVPTAL
jgi:hypothetical protein